MRESQSDPPHIKHTVRHTQRDQETNIPLSPGLQMLLHHNNPPHNKQLHRECDPLADGQDAQSKAKLSVIIGCINIKRLFKTNSHAENILLTLVYSFTIHLYEKVVVLHVNIVPSGEAVS